VSECCDGWLYSLLTSGSFDRWGWPAFFTTGQSSQSWMVRRRICTRKNRQFDMATDSDNNSFAQNGAIHITHTLTADAIGRCCNLRRLYLQYYQLHLQHHLCILLHHRRRRPHHRLRRRKQAWTPSTRSVLHCVQRRAPIYLIACCELL
jgi:hypothetical protein